MSLSFPIRASNSSSEINDATLLTPETYTEIYFGLPDPDNPTLAPSVPWTTTQFMIALSKAEELYWYYKANTTSKSQYPTALVLNYVYQRLAQKLESWNPPILPADIKAKIDNAINVGRARFNLRRAIKSCTVIFHVHRRIMFMELSKSGTYMNLLNGNSNLIENFTEASIEGEYGIEIAIQVILSQFVNVWEALRMFNKYGSTLLGEEQRDNSKISELVTANYFLKIEYKLDECIQDSVIACNVALRAIRNSLSHFQYHLVGENKIHFNNIGEHGKQKFTAHMEIQKFLDLMILFVEKAYEALQIGEGKINLALTSLYNRRYVEWCCESGRTDFGCTRREAQFWY